MRNSLILILLVLVGESVPAEEPENYKSTLETWRKYGASVWRYDTTGIEAGPDKGQGYLVSNEEYADVRLSIDFWIEGGTNSGIFLRCKDPADLTEITPLNCYEINIWDEHPNQDFRTGSIVTIAKPEVHVDSVGKWNSYVIEMRGPSIKVTLNGQQTIDIEDGRLVSGFIALQYASEGMLRFRNLSIERL